MNTITVRRANVVLDVPEEQKAEYLAKGFDVINANGKVVEATVPEDLNTLKTAYSNHLIQIKALQAENQKLKDEITQLKVPKPRKTRAKTTKTTDKS